MQENHYTGILTIRFLCCIAIMFAFLDILELKNIYYSWLSALKEYDSNKLFLDKCVKFPFLTKSFFTLFSLFCSVSAMIITALISISLEFFIEKCLLTFAYYNFYIFGPYLLFFSFLALMNFEKIIFNCKNDMNFSSENYLKKDYYTNGDYITNKSFFNLMQKNDPKQFAFPSELNSFYILDSSNNNNLHFGIRNNISNEKNKENNYRYSDKLLVNGNFVASSNIFNLISTITVSSLICLGMMLYETYDLFHCSILKLHGQCPIIRKLFWWIIMKNRQRIINYRNRVNEINAIVANNGHVQNNVVINNNNNQIILHDSNFFNINISNNSALLVSNISDMNSAMIENRYNNHFHSIANDQDNELDKTISHYSNDENENFNYQSNKNHNNNSNNINTNDFLAQIYNSNNPNITLDLSSDL